MSVRNVVKSIQDIMRQDVGVDGDAQRISQLCWMFFLKIIDDQDQELELMQEGYRSPIPAKFRWRAWAADPEGITGDPLLAFVNGKLFPALKDLPNTARDGRRRVVRDVFEDAYNYMKSGQLMRQVVNKINAIDFNNLSERQHFGDLYEQILNDLQSAGNAGEYYTPRAVTLEAIDTSDRAAAAREAMESAAARFRAAIRPWARLRLAHALLRESLNRFRERAQAPMVAAASTYFSLMTGRRYERLEANEEGDKPVLHAVQADGTRKGIEAMSDGTADQVYLALRLAALDLRRASHPRMPLVLDDVLIASDDERAGNILRALARFAEGGQVMIFTHHRHLIDVAGAALGDQALAVYTL